MGILRRLREWREDKDGTLIGPDIQADSVKTNALDNGVAGADTTLTRVVGGDDGDVLPIATYGSFDGSSSTTASTSYSNVFDLLLFHAPIDDLTTLHGDLVWNLSVRIDSGTGEQGSARLYNTTDGEPITGTEVTTTTGGLEDLSSGWVEYTPADTSRITRTVIQFKTSDGDDSSSVQVPAAYLGVKL